VDPHFSAIPYLPKRAGFYREVGAELKGIYTDFWISNLSNFSAMLMAQLPRINWVGFYLSAPDGVLKLGPFQGRVACLEIPLGKGVCGTAAQSRKTQLVADVHAFPGHIACDARSRSEIVVPMIHEGRVLGVLDIDSPEVARFDELDQQELERLVHALVQSTVWPASLA
jgi:GAF domain-containing protein